MITHNSGQIWRPTASFVNQLEQMVARFAGGQGMADIAGDAGNVGRYVKVQNLSDQAFQQCDVGVLTNPTFGPGVNLQETIRGLYSIHLPTEVDESFGTLHYTAWHAFGVTIEPLAIGAIGRAITHGFAPVRLYDPADGPGWDYALPRPEESHSMRRAPFGARIVWTDAVKDDDELRWAIISLPMQWPGVLEGILEEVLPVALAGGAEGTIASLRVYAVDATNPLRFIPTDDYVRVVNRDPTLAVAAGTYLQVTLQGREWRPIWAACGPRTVGCGNKTYRWQDKDNPFGSIEWRSQSESCGFEAWVWNDGHSGGGARWIRSPACPEGCAASTAPPDDGVVNGQIVLRPCGNTWTWYAYAENCAPGATPVEPDFPAGPDNEFVSVTIPCEADTEAEKEWAHIAGDCECGTADPPDRDGATIGETVIVPCE